MKLGATLLVPVVALVAVAGLEMLAAADEVREVHDQAELATAALGPPSLLKQLEYERNAAATWLLGTEDSVALTVENKEEAWGNTDAAIEDFRDTIAGEGGDVAAAYEPALGALGELQELRQGLSEYTGERNLDNNPLAREYFDRYSAIMDAIYEANAQVTPTISHRELRRGAELADLAARQSDTTARALRELLRAQFEGDRDGINTPGEVASLARVAGTLRRNAETIRVKAQGDYAPLAETLFATEHIQEYPALIDDILETGTIDIGLALNTSTGAESGAFGYTVFAQEVDAELHEEADAVRAEADARLLRYALLAGFALTLALILTWLVSRSLTRPLRSLTRQAKDMANNRLPDAVRNILDTPLGENVEVPRVPPIAVRTRDEVGDVAQALNTVQETALELAVEQAVLRRNIADSFVNLGRRNQNLLSRQLDFITELETNETDPDTLASLFKLDHLATRMRRNAESLLVLAGIEPPRRWAAPVRLTDVIRAALGEVEDYQRVSIIGVEPATIIGAVAADLAHLIAEFVENALTFSPPDQNVEVRGRHRTGGYTLAIIDTGFGMSPEDIRHANRRLAGAESFTVAPSKYLGHYVAGNLAARHGVTVQLEPTPGSGITVMMELPARLLADGEAAVAPVPADRLAAPEGPGGIPAGAPAPGLAAAAPTGGAPTPGPAPAGAVPGDGVPPAPGTLPAPGGGAPEAGGGPVIDVPAAALGPAPRVGAAGAPGAVPGAGAPRPGAGSEGGGGHEGGAGAPAGVPPLMPTLNVGPVPLAPTARPPAGEPPAAPPDAPAAGAPGTAGTAGAAGTADMAGTAGAAGTADTAGTAGAAGTAPPLPLRAGPRPGGPGATEPGAGALPRRPAPLPVRYPGGLPPAASPAPPPEAPAPPERTASGLLKRPRSRAVSVAAVPEGDLLDALRRHSRGAGRVPGVAPAGRDSATSPPAAATPAPATAAPEPGARGAAPAPDAAVDPWSALDLLPAATPRPVTPAPPRTEDTAPAAERPTAGRTASGLARRVPGANLPASPIRIRRGGGDASGTEAPGDPPPAGAAPASPGGGAFGHEGQSAASALAGFRAGAGTGGAGGSGPFEAGGSATPSRTAGGEDRAESVYSLLTNFTVGVQRGLDEAATGHAGEEADDSRPDA